MAVNNTKNIKMKEREIIMSLSGIKDEFLGIAREGIDRAKDEFADYNFEEGLKYQKNLDIISAAGMLLQLNVKKDQIYEMLNEYFGVDSINDAKEYIVEAKIRKQRKALRKSFASGRECFEFEKAHRFYDTLKANPELLDLAPEKLKKVLEKY